MDKTTWNHGLRRIVEARHHDPFALLGRHPDGDGMVIRVISHPTSAASFPHPRPDHA